MTKLYLIRKYGDGFWRPKRCGYTYSILEAGTYEESEVQEYLENRSHHSVAEPLEQYRVLIESAIERLNGQIMRFGGAHVSEYPGDPRD